VNVLSPLPSSCGLAGVAGVVSALAGEYDVDGETLERDVLDYVQELVDAGIVESSPG